MRSFEIDKTTAARKLFIDATLLFYERRSAIPIHHLAHAAHELLFTLTGDRHIFDSSALTSEGQKRFKREFNFSKNFIKHADKDPDSRITFKPEINIFILFDCAWMITLNFDKACVYSLTVFVWCAFVYPDLFAPEYIKSIENILKIPFNSQDFEAIAADLKSHYHDYYFTEGNSCFQ